MVFIALPNLRRASRLQTPPTGIGWYHFPSRRLNIFKMSLNSETFKNLYIPASAIRPNPMGMNTPIVRGMMPSVPSQSFSMTPFVSQQRNPITTEAIKILSVSRTIDRNPNPPTFRWSSNSRIAQFSVTVKTVENITARGSKKNPRKIKR